jgi:hypothetical protein
MDSNFIKFSLGHYILNINAQKNVSNIFICVYDRLSIQHFTSSASMVLPLNGDFR